MSVFRTLSEDQGTSRAQITGKRMASQTVGIYSAISLVLRIAAVVLCAVAAALPDGTSAQEIDFSKVNKFESLGSGTLRVGSPPKTILDDSEQHVVILTIWNAGAETKVYWRSPDGNAPRTTVMPGSGVQTFQTQGEFKLEAVGEADHEVQYAYVLVGLRK